MSSADTPEDRANAAPAIENSAVTERSSLSRKAVPIALAGLLLVAAVLIVIEVPGYRTTTGGEPGPAMLPLIVAGLSVLAAIFLIVQTLRGAHEIEDDGAGKILPVRILVAFASLIAGAILFKELGFFVVFAALMFVMGWLAGARRWWVNLIVAVATTWLVMIVFGRLFSVPLPAGPIDVILGG